MRISVKSAGWLWWILPLMLLAQGCDKKAPKTQAQTLAPPIIDTPLPQPASVSKADLPPPVIGEPQTAKPTAGDTVAPPAEPVKKPARRRPKPPVATTPPAPQQDAASTAPPTSVSAIGELSGGASGDLRSETMDSINAIEKGVNGISRTLSDSELKTAAQIHEFLKQAREALSTGDVDGAHTLALKAKVLLTELNQ